MTAGAEAAEGHADVNRAVADLTKAFGAAPDIVVGQTSDMTFCGFDDVTDEDIERVFRAFNMAQVYLARATLPAMRAKKWGRYIHIGAASGREPEFGFPHLSHNIARPSTVAFLRTLEYSQCFCPMYRMFAATGVELGKQVLQMPLYGFDADVK